MWAYDQQVALIEEVFGPASVHCYDTGDVLAEAYSLLGLAPLREGRRANASVDARIALWLAAEDSGTTREREAFGWSQQARQCLRGGRDGTLWPSEQARSSFLASLGNDRFGPSFFPRPRPLGDPAVLTSDDAARLTSAFAEWRAAREQG